MAAGGSLKTLIRMANQISDFFLPYSHDQCVAGVQDHLRKFWTPQMLRDLAAHIEHGGEGVRQPVIEAFQRITSVESPTWKASAGPKEAGEAFSDAG